MNPTEAIAYIQQLQKAEAEFKGKPAPQSPETAVGSDRLRLLSLLGRSLWDLIRWPFLRRRLQQQPLVFTAPNFFSTVNGVLVDRLTRPVLPEDVVYINHSKTGILPLRDGRHVFHTGGAAWLLSKLFFREPEPSIRYFLAYRIINNWLLRRRRGPVFTLCFYDMNGLSLVFSKHRGAFTLGEIQHGSIMHYPPYAIPAPVRIADVFYVRNNHTVAFLREHLCRHFESEFQLIPYPKVNRAPKPGLHLFYTSTIEFQGFHPVFQSFMAQTDPDSYTLTIRLHPRERGRETLFLNNPWKKDLQIDSSFNWLENLSISNTIVVSPWSSCIEEAVDNQLTSVVIDPVGQQRYQHLIDGQICHYTQDLSLTLAAICRPQTP